ncbi:MAG: CoA-binding protein, partial [Flavobacteriaceae bacterium]|nr:CoA-binding protein [Flavobacteriaceae bacterium]
MKKTLVLGASTNPSRYSNIAIHRLIQKNIPVVAVGLREGLVGDVFISSEKVLYPEIDTVTLYV